MDLEKVIIQPILTEKSNTMREKKKFAFKVDPRANKIEIAQAIRKLESISVLSSENQKGFDINWARLPPGRKPSLHFQKRKRFRFSKAPDPGRCR